MNHKITICNGEASFDSSFLIPEELMPLFEEKVEKFGGLSRLFQFVVNSKHPIYDYSPRTKTGRTSYTPEGLNLKKVNFKPNNEDWEKFRIIAQSQRISMCLLFVMILLFWNKYESDETGVPVRTQQLHLHTSLIFGSEYTIIKLCRYII